MGLYKLEIEGGKLIEAVHWSSQTILNVLPPNSRQFQIQEKETNITHYFALSRPENIDVWIDKSAWSLKESALILGGQDPENKFQLTSALSWQDFGLTKEQFDEMVENLCIVPEHIVRDLKEAIANKLISAKRTKVLNETYLKPCEVVLWAHFHTRLLVPNYLENYKKRLLFAHYVDKKDVKSAIRTFYEVWYEFNVPHNKVKEFIEKQFAKPIPDKKIDEAIFLIKLKEVADKKIEKHPSIPHSKIIESEEVKNLKKNFPKLEKSDRTLRNNLIEIGIPTMSLHEQRKHKNKI